MKKGFFQSILVRYMISYAAVMAVLFFGVSIYMNNSYADTIRTNTIDHNINRLGTLRMQHEEKLNTLVMIGSQISVSYYIRPFQLEEEPMKAYHLKQQLAPYSVTSDFSDQLYLIFSMDEYVYSSVTTMKLEMFVNQLMRYDATTPEELRAYLRRQDNQMSILPAQGVRSILTQGTYREMVTVFVPLLLGERYNAGNVMFLIDDVKYQRMFAEEIYEPRTTMILHGGQVLAASRGLALSDSVILDALGEYEDTLVHDLVAEGGKYLLIAQQGALYDMQYLTLIPHETMQASMAASQLGFMLFLFALSIPCIMLTIYFARRHAKPIRELRLLFGATAQAQDDFEAIQNGIAGLVDQNEQLQFHISESLPVQRGGFLSAFVKGDYKSREQAVAQAAALGMDIDKAYYLVALVVEPRDGDHNLDIDHFIACGEGRISGYGVQLVALEQTLFVVFADSEDSLDRWVWQVKNQYLPPQGRLIVAVSNTHQEFRHSANAYLEASTAYDNRFIMGNTHILRFADVSAATKDSASFAKTYLEGFRKALRTRDAHALNDRIQELFQYLRNTELSLFAFRLIYNNVIATLLGEQITHQSEGFDAMEYYDVFTLSRCQSIDDLDDILRKLCQEILSGEDSTPMQVHPLIRDIITHMNERYTDPTLSMSAIADTYGISAVRLSLDFKEITGMNPSEYLLLLRMEKAKELLATTGIPVKEVGTMVGYYDASGFIRRFKRYTAMTPAQYRKTVPPIDPEAQDPGGQESL